jgi:hypothetical protein
MPRRQYVYVLSPLESWVPFFYDVRLSPIEETQIGDPKGLMGLRGLKYGSPPKTFVFNSLSILGRCHRLLQRRPVSHR